MELSPATVEPFTGVEACPAVSVSCDPLELFSTFFTSELIESIVLETNRYAQQCLGGEVASWSTTTEEVKAYLGFYILMGIVQLPEIRDYWSTDTKLHYSPIASRISRDRFEQITRYLHFVDNQALPVRGEEGYHRLQKVLPVIKHVTDKFLTSYYPHMQNSIDEAMIPFKGKSYSY